jgi:hypothetical protein
MHEYVFGLDVPVDDVAVVHELDSVAHLLEDAADAVFGEAAVLLEGGVDVASAADLEDEVDVVFVGEEGVELHNVGVVQEDLDLDLPNQLVDELLLPMENALGDLLERTHEVGGLVPA